MLFYTIRIPLFHCYFNLAQYRWISYKMSLCLKCAAAMHGDGPSETFCYPFVTSIVSFSPCCNFIHLILRRTQEKILKRGIARYSSILCFEWINKNSLKNSRFEGSKECWRNFKTRGKRWVCNTFCFIFCSVALRLSVVSQRILIFFIWCRGIWLNFLSLVCTVSSHFIRHWVAIP